MTCYIRGLSKAEYALLREMCAYANNLYNKALYEVRQHYFTTGQYLRYEKNYHLCKDNENYKLLQSSVGVQVLKVVDKAFKAFLSCKKLSAHGRLKHEIACLPNYRKKGGLLPIVMHIGKGGASVFNGLLCIPQSRLFMSLHHKHRIRLPIPQKLSQVRIKEVQIIPVFGGKYFRIMYIYECEPEPLNLNPDHCLSVDIGLDNLAACVDSNGTAFIVDGRRIKSINHYWNQRQAKIQAIYSKQGIYIGHKLAALTDKRNAKIYDYIRKTSRYIINYCIAHDIGKVIVGCNPLWKDNINLGRVNNQNFTFIPFAYLRLMLRSLCERYGMAYIEQEEAYTSKASFLDLDVIPVYDGRTKHKFSGVRVKRGLYRSGNGTLINADINGAANILRKCKQNLNYERLCKGLMRSPIRIRLV